MNKLKNRVFNSMEEAKNFRPEILFYNKMTYDRVRNGRTEFGFFIWIGGRKILYDAYYRETENNYVSTERYSDTGLDKQYEEYGGTNYDVYEFLQEAIEQEIYTLNSKTLNHRMFIYPKGDYPSDKFPPSNVDFIYKKEFKKLMEKNDIIEPEGKFLVIYRKIKDEYNKKNTFIAYDVSKMDQFTDSDIPINSNDYHELYYFITVNGQIYATERLYEKDCNASNSGRWTYNIYFDPNGNNGANIGELGCEIEKAVDDTLDKAEEVIKDAARKAEEEAKKLAQALLDAAEDGVKWGANLFGEGIAALFSGLGIGNVLLISGILIVGGVVIIKVL